MFGRNAKDEKCQNGRNAKDKKEEVEKEAISELKDKRRKKEQRREGFSYF